MIRFFAVALTCSAAAFSQGVRPPVPRRMPASPVPARGISAPPVADPTRDFKFPPLHPVRLPAPVTATLSNGMKVFLVELHEMPVLGGVAMVRAGSALDPPEQIGLAAMAGQLLRSGGTALKTGDQVDETVRNLGMTLDSTVSDEAMTLTFLALKDNAAPSLTLVREVLAQAEFRQDRLDQAKLQARNAIAHRNDNPGNIAQRELGTLLYGQDSPYGWKSQYVTLEHITRTSLKSFHKRYFFPANTILGVWGDFNAGEMKAQLEHLFADWTVKADPVPEFPKVRNTPAPGIYLAEKKDAPQTWFAVGHLGGVANQKDYPALEVMGLAFNQLQARMMRRVREQFGSTNIALMGVTFEDVNATWGAGFEHAGVFRIAGSTRGPATAEAIKAVLDDIGRMRAGELSDEELKVAKDAAVGTLANLTDTHPKAFLRVMQQEFSHYPPEFAQQYQTAITAVTKADVLRVAKQYLNPANLTAVVVGNPQVFSEPLEKLNQPVRRIDLTIPEAKPQPIETTDTSVAEGKRLLTRAQAAAGGLEKLLAVKDYSISADQSIDPSVQTFGGTKVVQVERWLAPATFRQDIALSTGRVSALIDGKMGWIVTSNGSGPLTGSQLKQIQGDLLRSYLRLLISDHIEGRTVNLVDQDLIEIGDTTGQLVRVEFDPATGLPKRATYDVSQASGAALSSEDVYSNFREVAGIQVPFSVTITRNGRRFADVNITDYKINSGLKSVDLVRRQ